MDKSERVFKIPEFEYFDMGGKYSGNKRGTAQDDFNYHITPKDDIRVEIWYGINAFDLSEIVTEQVFEKTRDGYHAMLDWIEEQFRVWNAEHELLTTKLGTWTIPEKDRFYVITGKRDDEFTPEEWEYYTSME